MPSRRRRELPAPTPVKVEVEHLVANPRNPNQHGPDQLAHLRAALTRFGQTKPVLFRKENQMIVAGHGITEAAQQLGWRHLEGLEWDVDQETADAFMVADNRLAELSDVDTADLAVLLKEITDYESIGFSDEDAEKLIGGLDEAEAEIDIKEIDTSVVADDFWISVRGPLAQQAFALDRLQELMKELPGVEVSMGIIHHQT